MRKEKKEDKDGVGVDRASIFRSETSSISMITLRDATTEDAMSIQSIYAYYVINTVVTFEEEVPTVEEMKKRIQTITEAGYPYISTLR